MTIIIPFGNSYARLPERFHARTAPTPMGVASRPLRPRSRHRARAHVGTATPEEPAQLFFGNTILDGFVPQGGDGRAIRRAGYATQEIHGGRCAGHALTVLLELVAP